MDVTPERSVPMSGYGARDEPSSGVHDPLSATSLVVSDGATTVGVVSVDLLNVSRELTARVRRRLAGTEAVVDDVLVAATHTHAGPYVPAPAIDVNPLLSVDEDVSDVVDRIVEGCVESLVAAREGLEPARVRVGRATNDEVPINRRAEEGWARLPTGSVDPELITLDVRLASGESVVVVNFAMHPVCLAPSDTTLSTDWPGVVDQRVTDERDDTTVLFLNGACGDVNPRGRTATSGEGDGGVARAEAVGEAVAGTVLDALADAEDGAVIEDGPVSTDRRDLRLSVKETASPERLRAHRDDIAAKLDRLEAAGNDEAVPYVREELMHATERLHIAEWSATHLPATLQYVAVGPVGLLGMPAEVFVADGLALKDRAAVDTLLPVGYANGYVGYVPPLSELERVGYEVWTTKVSPDALTRFRDAAFDLVPDA